MFAGRGEHYVLKGFADFVVTGYNFRRFLAGLAEPG